MRVFATWVVIALVLLTIPAASQEHESAGAAVPIAPSELRARQAAGTAPLVIDVRTPTEYAGGHIPGSVNIPFVQVADRISEVEAPHGVALYCMIGPRARKGEAALLARGFTAVFHLEGGLAAWKAAGYPVMEAR